MIDAHRACPCPSPDVSSHVAGRLSLPGFTLGHLRPRLRYLFIACGRLEHLRDARQRANPLLGPHLFLLRPRWRHPLSSLPICIRGIDVQPKRSCSRSLCRSLYPCAFLVAQRKRPRDTATNIYRHHKIERRTTLSQYVRKEEVGCRETGNWKGLTAGRNA